VSDIFFLRQLAASNTDSKLSEKEHPSENDSKDHFTILYEDDEGNHISTKHVYP
jgi:hypothetical protein